MTLGGIYDSTDRTVPGSPAVGDHQFWIFEEELASLPGVLGEMRCGWGDLACHSAEMVTTSDDLSTADFWALIDELAATGIRLDTAFCEESSCNSTGAMSRQAHPGETLLVHTQYIERSSGGSLELSVSPWN